MVNLTKKIPTYVTKLAEAEGECLRAEGLVNDLISEYKTNVRLKDSAAADLKLATQVLNEAVTDLLTAKSQKSEVDVDTLVGACKVNIIELNDDIAKLEKELAQKKERLRKDTAELGDLED